MNCDGSGSAECETCDGTGEVDCDGCEACEPEKEIEAAPPPEDYEKFREEWIGAVAVLGRAKAAGIARPDDSLRMERQWFAEAVNPQIAKDGAAAVRVARALHEFDVVKAATHLRFAL